MMQGNGSSRPSTTSWAEAFDRRLPICQRWASNLGRYWELGQNLRGPLLPKPKRRHIRPGASSLVLRGRQRWPCWSPPRRLVALPLHPRRPRFNPYHPHLARLRPTRCPKLRPISLRRLRPQPPSAHAPPHPGTNGPRIHQLPQRPTTLLPLRAARRPPIHQLHGGGRHSFHPLAWWRVHRRAEPPLDVVRRRRDHRGVLWVLGGNKEDREGDREEKRRI